MVTVADGTLAGVWDDGIDVGTAVGFGSRLHATKKIRGSTLIMMDVDFDIMIAPCTGHIADDKVKMGYLSDTCAEVRLNLGNSNLGLEIIS